MLERAELRLESTEGPLAMLPVAEEGGSEVNAFFLVGSLGIG